jgi:hypothetical protein
MLTRRAFTSFIAGLPFIGLVPSLATAKEKTRTDKLVSLICKIKLKDRDIMIMIDGIKEHNKTVCVLKDCKLISVVGR